MRHSFLPANEQNALKRIYRVHLSIVALFMLSLAGLIGIGSLFPAFISAYTEERAQIRATASLQKDKDSDESMRIQRELRADNSIVVSLSETVSLVRQSTIISRLAEARGPVHISAITITEMSTTTATATIQGVAPTREALVAFKTRLEGLSPGNKVDLPIAGFAKSKDIPFSLKLSHILP